MDKVIQGSGRGTQRSPPLAASSNETRPELLSPPTHVSQPFNLCHSHTLPFCPTSNPYSPFILLTPHSLRSFHSFSTVWFNTVARLPSLVVTSLFWCRLLPLCLMMESSTSPGVSSNSANHRCNEARLPSTARWDFTSSSLPCRLTAKTEQHCHLLWLQIQLSSSFQFSIASFWVSSVAFVTIFPL